MKIILNEILTMLDIIVPRFVTEYAACVINADGDYETVCGVDHVDIGTVPDAVVKVTSFNIFGYAAFPRQVGEPMTWNEYLIHQIRGTLT